jgi:hypothetical protein
MTHPCESCGMPIEDGRYCQYCVDGNGALQDFDTRFSRMVEWRLREVGGDRAAAERDTLAHMATLPAWRDHPRVKAAR